MFVGCGTKNTHKTNPENECVLKFNWPNTNYFEFLRYYYIQEFFFVLLFFVICMNISIMYIVRT